MDGGLVGVQGDPSIGTEQSQKLIGLVGEILLTLGVSYSKDPNFQETPRRFARFLQEFVRPKEWMVGVENNLSRAVFPSSQDELVVLREMSVYSLCPHHLLPVKYKVAIGYKPGGVVIGLSKLSRLVKGWAKVPQLQEDYTVELRESMKRMLKTEDVGVIVEGRHLCMEMRGVEMGRSSAVTSSLSGIFLIPEVKREFMSLGRLVNED